MLVIVWNVRIANREEFDQTASESDLSLHCLSMPFWQANIFRKTNSNVNVLFLTTEIIFDVKHIVGDCRLPCSVNT